MKNWRIDCLAVLFDLDGVLVDSHTSINRHWERWAAQHGIQPERLRAATQGRRTVDTIASLAPQLDARAETLAMEEAQARDTTGIEICRGARELFDQLSNTQRAIVTSGTRRLAVARLRACGLMVPDILVTAEDVARGKPNPDGYLRAARALGVPAADCVVIEDSEAGVMAARAAGTRVIAVIAERTSIPSRVETDASVSSLAEVGVEIVPRGGRQMIRLFGR
jgi:sugar-phosphatase